MIMMMMMMMMMIKNNKLLASNAPDPDVIVEYSSFTLVLVFE